MNPEQQRIAIAEACGWTAKEDKDGFWRAVDPSGNMTYTLWVSEMNVWSAGMPDVLNDLNAMHEAEETLDASQCAEYARQLMKHHPTYCVTVLDNRFAPTEEIAYQTYQLLHATAAQRAEAFLRTIGKWEEGK